eukprot:8826284-Alexandrium_andersonii.AAC.1
MPILWISTDQSLDHLDLHPIFNILDVSAGSRDCSPALDSRAGARAALGTVRLSTERALMSEACS